MGEPVRDEHGGLEASEGTAQDWYLFPLAVDGGTSFSFERDDGSGRIDYVHIEPMDVPRVVRHLGGVPRGLLPPREGGE